MKRAALLVVALLLAAAVAWRLRLSAPDPAAPAPIAEGAKPDLFVGEWEPGVSEPAKPGEPAGADVRIPSFPVGEAKRVELSKGLDWLVRAQNADGSWGFGSEEFEGAVYSKHGATALALLAFCEAGHSHVSKQEVEGGTVGEVMKRGWKWLVDNPPSGAFDAALAALAWVEGYGLTNSAILKQYAVRDLEALMAYQGADGSWSGDAATTGWAAMAVRSARLGDLAMPEGAEEKLRGWYEARLAAGGGQGDAAGWLCVPGDKGGEMWGKAEEAHGRRAPGLDGEVTAGMQAAWVVGLVREPKGEAWEAWKKGVYDGVDAWDERRAAPGAVNGTATVVRNAMGQLLIESFFVYESRFGDRRWK